MSSDSGEDWHDWSSDEEESDMAAPTRDLFDVKLVHASPKAFLSSTLDNYGFDLKQFLLDQEFNTYRRIRCCNYLRVLCRDVYRYQYNPVSTTISQDLLRTIDTWSNNDDLLIPTLPDDGLVQFAATANHGFDSDDDQYWEDEDGDYDEDGDDDGEGDLEPKAPKLALPQSVNNMLASLSNSEAIGLLQQQLLTNKQQNIQIKMLQRQIDQLSEVLQTARTTFQEYAFSDDSSTSLLASNLSAQKERILEEPQDKSKFGPDDVGYFQSYSGRSIHEEMLTDKHRTESYERAIKQLGPLLQDKVVLDVGCGTGILSMFAAKYGAKHVIAVDAADIIDKTHDIVKSNGFEGKITLVKGKVEEVVLPFDTVDIIISEWMGYYLLYESMLPSVLYARNKWLRREETQKSIFEQKKSTNPFYQYDNTRDNALQTQPFAGNTRLLPDVARMFIAGATSQKYQDQNVNFWKDVYGFNMSVMIYEKNLFPGSSILVAPDNHVLTDNNMYAAFDMMNCTADDLSFTVHDVEIVAQEDAVLDSFLVWFDTPFVSSHDSVIGRSNETIRKLAIQTDSTSTHPADTILTTSPYCQPTHWMQTMLRLRAVMKVQKGDKVKLTIQSSTRKDNHRHYDVLVTYSFESVLPQPTDLPTIPNTEYAKPGTLYDQLFSLQ